MRTPSSVLLIFLVVACSDAVDPQKPGEPAAAVFTIADRSLWAGSGMLIESDAFAGLGSPPEVRLDGVPLEVSRIGPEVFEATLPTTASGQYLPTISLGKGSVDLPSIAVAGFSGAEELGFNMALGAEAMPGTGNATLIGASRFPGELEGRLTFVHLETGSHERFEGPLYDFDQLRTPGTSYRPGVMFGQTAEGIRPFSLNGATVVLEDPISVTLARQIAELAEGVYLVTSHHHVSISDGSYDQQLEESQGIALSHAAGRATVWGGNTVNIGLPVFTVPGGSLAFLLTEVFRPTAVEFSADGELLAVAGAEPAGNLLRIFRASDGELLEEQTLPAQPIALAFDPVRPLLYVGLGGTYGGLAAVKPSLMVFDRETFSLLGHLSAAAAELSCEAGCVEAEIAVSAEPAVYLAGFLNSPLRTFRYSIPEE
jgi:hypothetical protein